MEMKVEYATTDILITDDYLHTVWIPLDKIPFMLQQIAKILEEKAERDFDHHEAKLEH
jgi:hypothetical protein